jgi:hypothetical protein
MYKERNIIEVITQLITLVPNTEQNTEFIRQLERVSKNASYRAPETMVYSWSELTSVVTNHIPKPPKEDWEKKFIEYFTQFPNDLIGRSVEYRGTHKDRHGEIGVIIAGSLEPNPEKYKCKYWIDVNLNSGEGVLNCRDTSVKFLEVN